ncbi:hypothetical protein ACFSKN_15635 [Mariniflexile gromovii]|uniref:RiboL-PSP-HEPN domain-containing protein n=1 Tax=Mariniflexile gromovii TaxID=362523 RepID=A0ABS4BYS4_9FLAO|nr:hypothetical protein [Mariniflexile gromovii]MBP0905735.1 hypothetical protein [Mariniflexile gromovii]
MRIDKVKFNIKKAEAVRDNISNIGLKPFMDNYCLSLDQIITTLAIPYLFMTVGYQQGMLKCLPYSTGLNEIEKLDGYKEKDPKKYAEAIVKHFENKVKESSSQSSALAEEEINKLLENTPPLVNAYRILGLNALVNSWTIFEAFSKDLWKYVLNKQPQKFINNLLKSNNRFLNDIEGINGKQISISLLSKFNFDLSNNLGDILAPKYDFTSASGIKTAYIDLLNLEKTELAFLNDKQIRQLEITRHLIVHNAGIIDEDYLRRTAYKNEKLNDGITISHKDASTMINASVESVIELISLIDKKTKAVNKT